MRYDVLDATWKGYVVAKLRPRALDHGEGVVLRGGPRPRPLTKACQDAERAG
jgi:hypothetical protein